MIVSKSGPVLGLIEVIEKLFAQICAPKKAQAQGSRGSIFSTATGLFIISWDTINYLLYKTMGCSHGGVIHWLLVSIITPWIQLYVLPNTDVLLLM